MKKKQPAEAQGSAPAAAPFDPWTADEATVKARAWFDHYARAQWELARDIEGNAAIIKGAGHLVLRAIVLCAKVGLIPPRWLADEFCNRYDARMEGTCTSWDAEAAFGKPFPKNLPVVRVRARARRAWVVFREVQSRLAGDWDQTAAQVTAAVMSAVGITDERELFRLFAEGAVHAERPLFTTIPKLRAAIRASAKVSGKQKPSGPYISELETPPI